NQGGCLVFAIGKSRHRFGRGGGIAQANGEVALPALIADTANGRACGFFFKFLFGPLKKGCQVAVFEAMAGAEIVFPGGSRVTVRGADGLAVVTAKDTVAHQRAQLFVNNAFVLDGEVGNTAAGIENVRLGKGVGGANAEAGATAATLVVLPGMIQRQWQAGINFTEKKPGAGLAV